MICPCLEDQLWLWQIIDLLATDKSQYFERLQLEQTRQEQLQEQAQQEMQQMQQQAASQIRQFKYCNNKCSNRCKCKLFAKML